MTTELIIPAPCDWINANQRHHWAEKGRLTRNWRDAAYARAYLSRSVRFGDTPVHITATIHKTTRRKYDAANLYPTVKAAIDGLRDAGWLDDDDNAHVIGPDIRPGRIHDHNVLVLTIEPVVNA